MRTLHTQRIRTTTRHLQTMRLVAVSVALCPSLASAQELPKVTAAMQQCVDDGRIAGAVTLVGYQGEIAHLSAVGQADLATTAPMTADTLFAIASMTKPITAAAVMILQDEGKLSVGDPVSKYIPAFADAKLKNGEPVGEITLKHAMTHTAGIVGSQLCQGSLADTAEMLAARPFGFKPDEQWQYSPGLNVCGRIVEIVSGQPYEEFLAERIFEPLGMKRTTFFPTELAGARVASLYTRGPNNDGPLEPAERSLVPGRADDTPWPSGGLFSTAGDMFRFYQMTLNGGELNGRRIISAEAVKAMTKIQTGDLVTGFTPGNGWGLGWCVVRQPQGVTAMLSLGTFGHGGAFGTQGWVDPQRRAIYVLLIQRAGLPNGDASTIRRDFQQAAADSLEAVLGR